MYIGPSENRPQVRLHVTIPFLLASSSPRRRHLLDVLGIPFSVATRAVSEEAEPDWAPGDTVEKLALRKAQAVALDYPDSLVLGADTLVSLDDRILGKPDDASDAVRMLQMLSGRTHQVYTGLALVLSADRRQAVRHEATDVTFSELTEAEIRSYVASGAPMDKAGSYGIQDDLGATFVSSVNGDYYAVVGLPLHLLYRMLREDFGDLLVIEGAEPTPSFRT